MKSFGAILAGLTGLASAAPNSELDTRATVNGFDVSGYQPNVNFAAAYRDGARFVMIKVRCLSSTRGSVPSSCTSSH